MRFDELLYNDDVLDALDAMNFTDCTPIQEQAIPVAEEGYDLIAVAQTGTGKTAAYLLPVIDRLADGGYPDDAINCIVMAPTRELAMQIDQQMQGFSYFLPRISSAAIYGGTDGKLFEQQKRALVKGADVVIATPGRLIAHMQMGYVDLSRVSFFILDEADRMLDMGFFDDIMKVVSKLPSDRQTLMFSATMPPKIKELAKRILYQPKEIKIAPSKPAEGIDQSAFVVYETQKLPLLKYLFKQNPPQRLIMFAASKQKVKELCRTIRSWNYKVGEMHSDLDQQVREQTMLDFKANRINLLVATDIVSRGIDIDDISVVINYDVPQEPEDYVHRVGRTARASSTGRAITFISERDREKFRRIERLIEREVPKGEVPTDLGETPSYSSAGSPGRNRKGRKTCNDKNMQGKSSRGNSRRRGSRKKSLLTDAPIPKAEPMKMDPPIPKATPMKMDPPIPKADSMKMDPPIPAPTDLTHPGSDLAPKPKTHRRPRHKKM